MKKLALLLSLLLSSCVYIEDMGNIVSNGRTPSVEVPASLGGSDWVCNDYLLLFDDGKYTLKVNDTLTLRGEYHYRLPEGFVYFEKRNEVVDGWIVTRQSNYARVSKQKSYIVMDCTWLHYKQGICDNAVGIQETFIKE